MRETQIQNRGLSPFRISFGPVRALASNFKGGTTFTTETIVGRSARGSFWGAEVLNTTIAAVCCKESLSQKGVKTETCRCEDDAVDVLRKE
jgi:hypothetical protein